MTALLEFLKLSKLHDLALRSA